MTSVSYRIFEEFVKNKGFEKVQVNVVHYWIGGFVITYHYLNGKGDVMAIEEDGENSYYEIENEEAENLNTLEFVNNIIKNKNGR